MYRLTEDIELDGMKKRGFRLPTMLACNFTVPNTKLFNPMARNFTNYKK